MTRLKTAVSNSANGIVIHTPSRPKRKGRIIIPIKIPSTPLLDAINAEENE